MSGRESLMSKEDAIVVLECLAVSCGTCRTEKEALEVAIRCLSEEKETED